MTLWGWAAPWLPKTTCGEPLRMYPYLLGLAIYNRSSSSSSSSSRAPCAADWALSRWFLRRRLTPPPDTSAPTVPTPNPNPIPNDLPPPKGGTCCPPGAPARAAGPWLCPPRGRWRPGRS